MLEEILEALAPHFVEMISALITLFVGWTSVRIHSWTGIQIEAKHREALHSAMMNGALMALDGNLSGKKAVDLIVDYARRSVPDAIRHLVKDESVLFRLAEAKLQQILAR